MKQTPTLRVRSLFPEAAAALQQFKTFATAHTLLSSVDKHLSRAIDEPAGFAYVLLYGPSGVGKTTLIRQLERRNTTAGAFSQVGYHPGTGLPGQLPPVPLVLLETRPPDGSTFNRSDYYRIALKQLGEHMYERRTLVNIDGEHVWEQKKGNGKVAKFNDSPELRQVYEAALQRRGVRTIILDEAQHLLKLSSGIKLLDQLDWLKSMTNTTGVLHILTGTYELLALRNLNGQTARRGLEIHFPRYQFQHEPDQRDFQRALLTLLQQVPLRVEVEPLLQQWPYFYERSIGCIGVLKDWLIRAVAASLADEHSKLLFERIQECALPIAQCESMAMEAASGEQELHYTASKRQHLWTLLGMNTGVEVQKEPPTKAPEPQKRPRVGVPQPVRYDVGEPKSEERAENCSFSGAAIALIPTQLEQAGVAKLQCPECGAAQKARVRGEAVFYPTHHPPLKKRSQNIPRWIRQGTTWTLTQ
jgi:AAA domain